VNHDLNVAEAALSVAEAALDYFQYGGPADDPKLTDAYDLACIQHVISGDREPALKAAQSILNKRLNTNGTHLEHSMVSALCRFYVQFPGVKFNISHQEKEVVEGRALDIITITGSAAYKNLRHYTCTTTPGRGRKEDTWKNEAKDMEVYISRYSVSTFGVVAYMTNPGDIIDSSLNQVRSWCEKQATQNNLTGVVPLTCPTLLAEHLIHCFDNDD
jgi:hypothetical protein